MGKDDYLFSKIDWLSVGLGQKQKILSEIAEMEGNRLLNTSVDDLCDYFEKKYRIEVPSLRMEDIIADQRETKVDVSGDRMRAIRDRSRPFHIPGTVIEVSVPFDGDAEAFKIQPSSYSFNPPYGEIRGGKLYLRIEGVDLKAERVRAEIDRTLSEIQGHLTDLRKDVDAFNGQINKVAREAIDRRRQKLLTDQNLVASLGFKIKERGGAPRTYAAPEVRRAITPVLLSASASPYKPEPVLSDADYDHILDVVQNMAYVMELSPNAFQTMDEESLRSHFLVQLNGHYEGQATGETFNYEGKTDILIRSEGRNIFIAECKFWDGPKKLLETIDQLLSYSSWRDTKVAVIIFNRKKDFTRVLDSIRETVKTHSNFKKALGAKSETNFRYVFAHRDDRNREMILSVLAFDVPS